MESSLGALQTYSVKVPQPEPSDLREITNSQDCSLAPEVQPWPGSLAVALVGPIKRCRGEIMQTLAATADVVMKEFHTCPERAENLYFENFDMVILDVDGNPERTLEFMEKVSGNGSTVIAYSERSDSEILMRCLRAGAREFLSPPFDSNTLTEAIVRVAARRASTRPRRTKLGELLIFVGAKGGSGVTTVASSFALSLTRESGKRVVLIDLALPLGDAALQLGLKGQYSTADALMNFSRVDSNFLSTLLVKHDSGLQVLAAPDKYSPLKTSDEAVSRLLAVSRQDFDYVVVDGGPRPGLSVISLIENAARIYLVAQATVPDLRRANYMIARFIEADDQRLEIVLNRFPPRLLALNEERISNTLTRPANWKIPSHYFIAQRAKHSSTVAAQKSCPISNVIRQMARAACGLPRDNQRKTQFRMFA